MADNLSTVKVSGTSTEKTAFESTLKAADAGFQFTVVGGPTFTWSGSAFNQSGIAGAEYAYVPYPDVTAFDSTVVTPIANVNVAFVTVPAGCYALNIKAVKATVGAIVTIFSGLCYIERNAAAAATGDFFIQAQEDVTFLVDPGDTINFMGSTGVAGQLFVTPLG